MEVSKVREKAKVLDPETIVEQNNSSNRRKIGILGGTFNPPHIGHLLLADQVKDQLNLEDVHFMPNANPAHVNEKTTIRSDYRVDMVDLAIEDNPEFSLNLTEVNRGGTSYTIDTIKELKEASPNTDYYFIIGGDMVEDLKNWKSIDELVELVQFVAVRRPTFKTETPYPVIWVDIPQLEVSSSEIREKVSTNCSIRYLVPEQVIDYIDTKGLYVDDKAK